MSPVLGTSAVLTTPCGALRLCARGDALVSAEFLAAATPIAPASVVLRAAAEQVRAYFNGRLRVFSVPLRLSGSRFQLRVWAALGGIGWGTTRSYGALAQLLGTSARAVGGACRANPVVLLVPCHRVVAAHGLGGYMGAACGPQTGIKAYLLAHERAR